jgi:wobble nucleotide-excising tRNase
VLTPEEKAAQYREMQQSVFANFIKDFEAEEASILTSLESATQQEKQRDIEKREREEAKRLEKTLFKKDQQDVEELYTNCNVKALRDRITKTITEGIIKQQKVL